MNTEYFIKTLKELKGIVFNSPFIIQSYLDFLINDCSRYKIDLKRKDKPFIDVEIRKVNKELKPYNKKIIKKYKTLNYERYFKGVRLINIKEV